MYSSEAVSQIIPTIQGEIRIGEPVILVRLKGCNYHCSWCDTKYTWLKSGENPQLTDEDIEAIIAEQYKYPEISKLMITGGEPLLYATQDKFYELLNIENFKIIHIETNGSLLNISDFNIDNWTAYTIINISPKFEQISNYNEYIQIIKKFVYKQWIKNAFQLDVNLKFVYNKESEPLILQTAQDLFNEFGKNKIYVMSQTPDLSTLNDKSTCEILEQFIKSDKNTIEFCMRYGFNFTPRFHTYLFGRDKNESLN